MSRRDARDGDYPPGVTGRDPHFDMPSTDDRRSRRPLHAACTVCRRGPHFISKLFDVCTCPKCTVVEL